MIFKTIRNCSNCGKPLMKDLISFSYDLRPVVCSPECRVERLIRRGDILIGDHPELTLRVYTGGIYLK